MRNIFLLLFFMTTISCSAKDDIDREIKSEVVTESEVTIQATTINDDSDINSVAEVNDAELNVDSQTIKNCHVEKMIQSYAKYLEMGIKLANSVSQDANIKVTKHKVLSSKVKKQLIAEFSKDVLKNSCAVEGLDIVIKGTTGSAFEIGAYQVTFQSEKDANQAVSYLENLDREHFKTNKLLTLFELQQQDSTIIIVYYDQALSHY